MTAHRPLAAIGFLLLPTACQSADVAAICTTLGTVEAGLSVEVQYADGGQISAVFNPASGQVSVTMQVYESDMVSVLQEAAVAALDAPTPEGAAPCEGLRATTLTVLFDDASARSVTGTCPASPLDVYTEALFATFATERVQLSSETQVQDMELTTPEAACTEDWRAAF